MVFEDVCFVNFKPKPLAGSAAATCVMFGAGVRERLGRNPIDQNLPFPCQSQNGGARGLRGIVFCIWFGLIPIDISGMRRAGGERASEATVTNLPVCFSGS